MIHGAPGRHKTGPVQTRMWTARIHVPFKLLDTMDKAALPIVDTHLLLSLFCNVLNVSTDGIFLDGSCLDRVDIVCYVCYIDIAPASGH